MARRRTPGQREYNPLDEARGRLAIDPDLVRAVMDPREESLLSSAPATAPVAGPPVPSDSAAVVAQPPAPVSTAMMSGAAQTAPQAVAPKGLVVERLTKYNKFLTTPSEKLELDRLAARISGALGVNVRPSHLIRACLIHLLHAENEIIEQSQNTHPLRRPSNTEAIALAEFDQLIAEILYYAFRSAKPLGLR